MIYKELIKTLKRKGVVFKKGLSPKELNDIERLYGIKFPPDLASFLKIGLPISNNFINWRDISGQNQEKIRRKLEWPIEGMIFDIKHNDFWYEEWGEKPIEIQKSIAICRKEMSKVPPLIPICSHRYIPSVPFESNNPIFSIYQTDIIYYGENLLSYLYVEFGIKSYETINFNNIKKIEF